MNSDNLIKNLEELIETNIDSISVPYVKGNSIRIKNYVIRKNKNGYVIYDCKENKRISELSFKISALALTKTLAEGKNYIQQIEYLDRTLTKNYNDVLFYKNTIKSSKDSFVKETRKSRMEVSIHRALQSKKRLEDFIF